MGKYFSIQIAFSLQRASKRKKDVQQTVHMVSSSRITSAERRKMMQTQPAEAGFRQFLVCGEMLSCR